MAVKYCINNLLNDDTYCCASSINAVSGWVLEENLYNANPSFPFRFDDVGSVGNPEWICWDLGSAIKVSLVAIFNHNIELLTAVGDEWKLKFCTLPCEGSGACNWDAPAIEIDLAERRVDNFRNIYREINQTFRYGRVDIIDQNNVDGYVEYGELFVGQIQEFSRYVHVQPGRPDGPIYYKGDQKTYYGQKKAAYYSRAERLVMTFRNTGDPNVVDEFHTFLNNVQLNNGIFVIIPDDSIPFAYYVQVMNMNDFANRTVYNPDCGELREWKLNLETLTEGIALT